MTTLLPCCREAIEAAVVTVIDDFAGVGDPELVTWITHDVSEAVQAHECQRAEVTP